MGGKWINLLVLKLKTFRFHLERPFPNLFKKVYVSLSMNDLQKSITQNYKLMLVLSKTEMKRKILILFFLPLFMACNKDPEIPYCELHPDECVDVRDVKDYFYFKHGSYWVYEEENTGLRDSVFVHETWSDTESVLFSTELISTYDGYEYRFWTTGVNGSLVENNLTKKSDKSTRVVRSKGKPGDYVGEDACFLFYPMSGLWTYTYGGPNITNNVLQIENVFTNYTVIDNNFKDVVYISEQHTAVEEKQPTNHYYSPSIGLVKKELLDSNQIWNLIDYHIEN